MRRVRLAKKAQNLQRSVQSQSRQIIDSIYNSTIDGGEMLEFGKSEISWANVTQNSNINIQQTDFTPNCPLQSLIPLLSHLSKGFYANTCSFIVTDDNSIHIVTSEHQIKVVKNKKEKGRLRYWLSSIYFSKLRVKLAEDVLIHRLPQPSLPYIVHHNEQKEYMPSIIAGKKGSSVVKNIRISSQSYYQKRGILQSQPFCVAYFKKGAQQLFSFSEILSFVQYQFNVEQISNIRMLVKEKDGAIPIKTAYSSKKASFVQKQKIDKFMRMTRKQQRWRYIWEQFEQQRNNMILNEEYADYAELLLLEIIAFLQAILHLNVIQLGIEWIIDQTGMARIFDCFSYKYSMFGTIDGQDSVCSKQNHTKDKNIQSKSDVCKQMSSRGKVQRWVQSKIEKKISVENSCRLGRTSSSFNKARYRRRLLTKSIA